MNQLLIPLNDPLQYMVIKCSYIWAKWNVKIGSLQLGGTYFILNSIY